MAKEKLLKQNLTSGSIKKTKQAHDLCRGARISLPKFYVA
jgi:hypothetical protein